MPTKVEELPCDPAVAFRFADGTVARTLAELAERVEASPGLADHHRHHFHPWVRDILRDPVLARDIQRLAEGGGGRFPAALAQTLRDRITLTRKMTPEPGRRRTATRR